jgi:hypothetical protein
MNEPCHQRSLVLLSFARAATLGLLRPGLRAVMVSNVVASLGHKNIAHTVRYTDLAPDRFKSFWKD